MRFFDWRLWISEDFLKTLKVKKFVWRWRLGNHLRNMKHETFVFTVSFSLSWVIGNTVLLKGVEEILRKIFHVMLNSKSYTYQSFRVKPLEILHSSVIYFSGRDEVLLVSEEFVLTEELGIRQCGLPTRWGTWQPWGIWESNIPTVVVLRASCPKISTHLTVT